MPFFRVDNTMVHLKLGGPRNKRPQACRAPHRWLNRGVPMHECCGISTFLCDFAVDSEGNTCDMPLCPEHATEVGPDRHLCPTHAVARDA